MKKMTVVILTAALATAIMAIPIIPQATHQQNLQHLQILQQ